MRCLAVVIVAVLLAGSVAAQPRFTVQEPPAPEVRDNAQRARDLGLISQALIVTGVGFWALETLHQRESCAYLGNAEFDCVKSKQGIYTWGAVGSWSGAAALILWKMQLERHSVDVRPDRIQYSVRW